MPHRVYVVEDFGRLRETILDLIDCSEGLEASGSSGSAESALSELPGLETDMMLIDVSLPGMSGLDLLAEVRRLRPAIQCIMVSGHRSVSYAQRAREAGARAYVVKTDLYRLASILVSIGDQPSSFYAYGVGTADES
jgi:two-component system response regulator YesN